MAAAALQAKPQPLTRYEVGGMRFELREHTADQAAGVYFIGKDKDGNEKSPQWLCSPLRILAMTRGAKSFEWGRLLEWDDADGVQHRWAMPMELLQGDGLEVLRELARRGQRIAPGKAARDMLATYLQVWPVTERARCVDRLGWCGGVYVLPDQAIGGNGERVVFQNAHGLEPALSTLGTASQWRDEVAALAAGNSRMVFALSCALAGPLLGITSDDAGGFHLRGPSSCGKSTALALAASVWGNPQEYPRLWRTTANGLEGLAALHNHGLLILDELSQVDPREAGDAAYMLANGQGKTRASRSGTAKPAARWTLLFLSAGEESLSGLMARAGKKANAGQEIRLADIEADAGAGLGAFDCLNGQPSAAALALAIKEAVGRCFGAVGVEWLKHLARDRAELADTIGAAVREFVHDHVPKEAAGQVLRVARRFGLVAEAGELATRYGLTGWQPGEAEAAAGRCFDSWLESFGGPGRREDRALLQQVRAFFEAHGSSRFQDVDDAGERIINRAGFFRTGADGSRQFFVMPEVFRRELCAGFDHKAAAAALVAAGVIQPGADGKSSRTLTPRALGQKVRVYAFTGKLMEADE
ncbi:DUF927 domain-containing protein [Azohydromonas sp. G-1-1-14]|uniref:DUF927 domain-containing protein n=2 Tax=Azohydromonas caseinilytica TaxID=2728836 RepID=A0A848F589_9BURK|nr:DUF927 domain-containing protein [Azohydromonas caseinilytica]